MDWTLAFDPLVPVWLVAALGLLVTAIGAVGLVRRMRGAWFRLLAGALLVLALADPTLVRERRQPLDGVVAIVADRSASQKLVGRAEQTERAIATLSERLARFRNLEVRRIDAGDEVGGEGTRLFAALTQGLGDVPRDRIAAAILVTDGRVHDIPGTAAALGIDAPVHGFITGRDGEVDRRLELVAAPRFGLVGKEQTITVRVEDAGARAGGTARLTIGRDGENLTVLDAPVGAELTVPVEIAHGGANIFELSVEGIAGELTEVNNRAVVEIEGIRDTLRVLLVSGEPHPGERTWRNLLKSDANVDLVHFTILRPPEKQDGTPINQLSLIAFPTRELFQEKIDRFDLIVFDRYRRRGVLPILYFDNMARYVRDGGAILIASGPEYADLDSVFETPLAPVLPGAPTGQVIEAPFVPMLSEAGKRHPVTRDLPGSETNPPGWSRWFRVVGLKDVSGETVMEGPDGRPLLVLGREGEGRVALFASDHVWLWARGFQGGGPHVDLLRRLAHWLMKEPDLEEEALTAKVFGGRLVVERQTMAETVPAVMVTAPTGTVSELAAKQTEPGRWRAEMPIGELGLYRVHNGDKTAIVHAGPPNPLEFKQVTSSTGPLSPLVGEVRGGLFRLAEKDGAALDLPRIVPVRSGSRYAGADWLGFRETNASVLTGIDRVPLFLGLIGLLALLAAFAAMWTREGR